MLPGGPCSTSPATAWSEWKRGSAGMRLQEGHPWARCWCWHGKGPREHQRVHREDWAGSDCGQRSPARCFSTKPSARCCLFFWHVPLLLSWLFPTV